jgi:hypothetical protein
LRFYLTFTKSVLTYIFTYIAVFASNILSGILIPSDSLSWCSGPGFAQLASERYLAIKWLRRDQLAMTCWRGEQKGGRGMRRNEKLHQVAPFFKSRDPHLAKLRPYQVAHKLSQALHASDSLQTSPHVSACIGDNYIRVKRLVLGISECDLMAAAKFRSSVVKDWKRPNQWNLEEYWENKVKYENTCTP